MNRMMIFLVSFFLNFTSDLFSCNTFMCNNERTGYVDEYISPPFDKIWEIEIPGNIISSPVIYKDKVIITTRFGYVVALDLKTGLWLWDYSTSGFNDSTPYVSSLSVIVSSLDGYLYSFALDVDTNVATNAKVNWQTNLNAPSFSSPLVYKNKVYVGASTPENSLYILDFLTGEIIKKLNFEKPINSAITLCGDRIVFGGNDGRIYSMNLDGDDLKYYQTAGGSFNMKALGCSNEKIYSIPGYDERRLYVNRATDTTKLADSFDLSGNVGEEWNWQDSSSLSISSDTLYFTAGISTTNFIAIKRNDLTTSYFIIGDIGDVSDYKISPSPIVSQNLISFATTRGKFYVISSSGGIIFEDNLNSSSYSTPAISKGYIVISDFSGKLQAYKAHNYLSFYEPNNYDIIKDTVSIKISYKLEADSFKLHISDDDVNYNFISSSTLPNTEEEAYKIYDLDTKAYPNGKYYLKVELYNNEELKAYSKIKVIINQKPAPPQNLTAFDNPDDNCNKIKLSWDGVMGVKGYNVYKSSYNLENWFLLDKTTNTFYLDRFALCGATFSYKISSYDDYFESDFSNIALAYSINDNPLNDLIPPVKVNDLNYTKGVKGGSIILSWTQSGDDENIGRAYSYEVKYTTSLPFVWEYAIRYGTFPVLSASGEIETIEINWLLSNLTYYFGIKIFDYAQNESDVSNIVEAHPQIDLIPPSPPTNFLVYDTEGDRGGKITLEWEKSSDDGAGENDVYGYKIFRSTRNVFNYNNPYIILERGREGYIDNNATTGIKYYYQVCSYDSTNLSCSDIKWAISSDNYVYVSVKNGGVIFSKDGAYITIPQGGLNQDDYLIFYRLKSHEISTLGIFSLKANENFTPTNIVYELKSSNPNTSFISNISITIPYTNDDVIGLNEDNLRMFYLEGNTWKVLRKFELDKDNNKIIAYNNKLGRYGVFEYKPQGSIFDENFVYTYPNPATGDKLIFKFSLNDNADIKIRVYNIAGEIIKEFEKKNCLAASIEEIEWDIRNIASGVYIYVFEADNRKEKKKVEKKIAIIK